MRLVKKSKRKRFYHTERCIIVQSKGHNRFVDLDDTSGIHVEEDRLEHCGHCKGVEKSTCDRSYYQTLKKLGDATND